MEHHEYEEHLYIIAGSFVDEHRASGPGTSILNRAGSEHQAYAPDGCTFLEVVPGRLRLRLNSERTCRRINFRPCPVIQGQLHGRISRVTTIYSDRRGLGRVVAGRRQLQSTARSEWPAAARGSKCGMMVSRHVIEECIEGTLRLFRSNFAGPVNIGLGRNGDYQSIDRLARGHRRQMDRKEHVPGPQECGGVIWILDWPKKSCTGSRHGRH